MALIVNKSTPDTLTNDTTISSANLILFDLYLTSDIASDLTREVQHLLNEATHDLTE